MLPKVDSVGLTILFLLIPGIVALGIVKSIGPKQPRSDFENGLQIFVYGIVSYAIAGLLEGVRDWWTAAPAVGFYATVTNKSLALVVLNANAGLDGGQVAFATLIAMLIGVLTAYMSTHSFLHRALRWASLTKRSSEVDIWELTLNSPDIDSWVTVRHHENGKVYQGWVRGYSDGGGERELLLADVTVFVPDAETGDLVEVDAIPVLYLGLDRKNAIVELSIKSAAVKEVGI